MNFDSACRTETKRIVVVVVVTAAAALISNTESLRNDIQIFLSFSYVQIMLLSNVMWIALSLSEAIHRSMYPYPVRIRSLCARLSKLRYSSIYSAHDLILFHSLALALSVSLCIPTIHNIHKPFCYCFFFFFVCSVRNFARHRGNGSMEVLSFAFKSVMIESFRRRHRYSSFYPFKLRFGYENLPPIYPSDANGFFLGELCNCDLSVCACFCNRHNVSN